MCLVQLTRDADPASQMLNQLHKIVFVTQLPPDMGDGHSNAQVSLFLSPFVCCVLCVCVCVCCVCCVLCVVCRWVCVCCVCCVCVVCVCVCVYSENGP